MERIPLTGEVVFKSTAMFTFTGRLQYMDSTDFSLIYKTEGRYKGQTISGKMIEYFPDDTADMYYDIFRGSDNKIEIGKLSVKPFNKGKNRFRDYYEAIAREAESQDNELILFEKNNTFYVFINDNIRIKEKKSSDDIINFALLVCKNAAVISDYGFQINCSEYVTGSSDVVIPAGPFILPDSEENIVQKNILNFGLMFFRLIFGREATTFDRCVYTQRKKSEITLSENISDEDFDVVCNIINKTIQHNRDNCFPDFAEIINEFEKII